jgi:amidase
MLFIKNKSSYQSLLFASFFIFACSQNEIDLTALNDAKNNFHAITHIYDEELTGSDEISIFIKDNIDSIGASNTAGSLALLDNIPSQDAFLVSQLKAKNYRVIGKTNLSEWANFRSFDSISGWSSYGGQTIHFLGNNFNPCGSSSGSAVVVALGLVNASIGTETNGSISCPASVNGIVGIKPTVGVVSRTGIIPISPTQDTAGPMAKDVTQAAKLLSAIAGVDNNDPATLLRPESFSDDFTNNLNKVSLKNKKFGLLPSGSNDPEASLLLTKISNLITQAGGTLVEINNIPAYPGEEELFVLLYEFKHALEAYLQNSSAELKTLEAIMQFNEKNADSVMEYFDQSIFTASLEASTDHAKYEDALQKVLSVSRNFIETSIDNDGLIALIGLTRGPAWKIDSENGDNGALENYPSWGNGGFAAMAGTPHITIPLGEAYGLPIGLSIMGKAWSDHEMIQLAYTLEQLLK